MKYTLASSRKWYNNLPGKRASAAAIIEWNGKYLMVKDDYKNAMTFPGGVIDRDESPFHTAVREAKEEAGIALRKEQVQFYSVSYVKKHFGFADRFHFFFYAVIDDKQASTIRLEQGIEYYKWVDADEIGKLAGGRGTYGKLGQMLQTNEPVPYFETLF